MAYENADWRPHRPAAVMVDGDHNDAEETEETGEGHPREREQDPEYVFETRPGGCDVRRRAPEPVLVDEEAEYADAADVASTRCVVDGVEEMPDDSNVPPGGALSAIVWFVCTVVALWMFTIASPFIANALSQHGWRLWTSLAIGCLPVVFVFGMMVYVFVRFFRMPRFEQLKARAFSNKAELQRRLMASYLANFPSPEQYAADNGFANEDGNRTRKVVAECLAHLQRDAADSRAWLVAFDRFQSLQDERAEEIIFNVCKHVGLTTAACPWRILDMVTVVYHSTRMIARLAKLYNRRTSSRAAFWLGCHWIVNIYVSGTMQNAAQQGVEIAASAVGGLTNVFSKALGAVVGKSTEGLVNALLVNRLGRRAMMYFRPLVEAKC